MDTRKYKTAGSSTTFDLPLLLQRLATIEKQLPFPSSLASLIAYSESIGHPSRRIMLTGFVEAKLINFLLQQIVLPDSLLSFPHAIDICACPENTKSHLLVNEQQIPIQLFNTLKLQELAAKEPIQVRIENEWLKNNNIILSIRQLIADQEKFPDTDLVVLITDALAAMQKTECAVLSYYMVRSIPSVTAIARLQSLEPTDRQRVETYVARQLKTIVDHRDGQTIHIIDYSFPDAIVPDIEKIISTIDVPRLRTRQAILKATDMLAEQEQRITFQLQNALGNLATIREKASGDSDVLDELNDQWTAIENMLTQKRQELEQLLKEHLAGNRDQVIKKLSYDIERSQDPKSLWDRDLPLLVTRELQTTAECISEQAARKIAEILQWLDAEITARFGLKESLAHQLNIHINSHVFTPEQLNLLHIQPWRISNKFGNAAAVIGFTMIAASIPFGGFIIAASIVYQAGSEKYLYDRTQKEKKMLKEKIAPVIHRAEIAYVNEAATKLKASFDAIISNLRKSQQKWFTENKQRMQFEMAGKIRDLSIQQLDLLLEETRDLLKITSQQLFSSAN